MKSPAIALMFAGPSKKPESDESYGGDEGGGEGNPTAGESESGMSDAEAHHHAQVTHHLAMAERYHGKGKHKAVGVHLKLAGHHHAAAMHEAAAPDEESSEGGTEETTPGGQPEAESEMGEEE